MRLLIRGGRDRGGVRPGPPRAGSIPEYGYEVVHAYPHDPMAFTQGLFYLDGFLYEGTGLYGSPPSAK